jgi:hypothetical protein
MAGEEKPEGGASRKSVGRAPPWGEEESEGLKV